MVPTQEKVARELVALATKKAVLRDAAKLIVAAKKEAAAPVPVPAAAAAPAVAAPAKWIPGAPKKPGVVGAPKDKKNPAKNLPALATKGATLKVVAGFIKASRALNTNRKAALTKAAAYYQRALKSGNRGHIKKATAYLAEVLTFAKMEKSALAGSLLGGGLTGALAPAAGNTMKKHMDQRSNLKALGKQMQEEQGRSGVMSWLNRHLDPMRTYGQLMLSKQSPQPEAAAGAAKAPKTEETKAKPEAAAA